MLSLNLWFWSAFFGRDEPEVAIILKLFHAVIEFQAGISVGSCVHSLLFIERIGLPIGKLRIFRDALAEEIGEKLRQTHIFDAHLRRYLLQIHEIARLKRRSSFVQLLHIVFEREANFFYLPILEQMCQGVGQSHVVEPEKEAKIGSGHLQKRHFMLLSLAKRRAGLCVDAQFCIPAEVLHSSLRFTLTLDDNNSPIEGVAGECSYDFLVRLDEKFLHKREVKMELRAITE